MHPSMEPIHLLDQANGNAEDRLDLNQPNIRVVAQPAPSDNPLISTANLKEFAEKELTGLDLSTITRGISAIVPESEYWELNEYGLVYYRKIWFKKEYLLVIDLIKYIVESMKKAASFYKKYGHIRKILIVVTLEQVLGEHLAYPEDPDKRRIELRKCKLPEVYADAGCPAEDLVDREHLISTVDKEIVFPLIQAFDGPIKQKKNDPARRKLIEHIVERRFW